MDNDPWVLTEEDIAALADPPETRLPEPTAFWPLEEVD